MPEIHQKIYLKKVQNLHIDYYYNDYIYNISYSNNYLYMFFGYYNNYLYLCSV
jgi:hypothetical protein